MHTPSIDRVDDMEVVLIHRHAPGITVRRTTSTILGHTLRIQGGNDEESAAVLEAGRECIALPNHRPTCQNVDIKLRLRTLVITNMRVVRKPARLLVTLNGVDQVHAVSIHRLGWWRRWGWGLHYNKGVRL